MWRRKSETYLSVGTGGGGLIQPASTNFQFHFEKQLSNEKVVSGL